jgi:hypothetical protein
MTMSIGIKKDKLMDISVHCKSYWNGETNDTSQVEINWNEEVWLSLAKLAPACGAPDCPMCIRQCSVPRLAMPVNGPFLGIRRGVVAIIYRTVQWDSCVPGQRSVARSAAATSAEPIVTRVHRTVWCSTRLFGVPWVQWMATVGFAKEGKKLCTVHCPVCTGESGAPADKRQ